MTPIALRPTTSAAESNSTSTDGRWRFTGGVDNSGLTVSMYVYKTGWSYLDMGTASAISWILFLLIAVVSALVFWGFGNRGGLKDER